MPHLKIEELGATVVEPARAGRGLEVREGTGCRNQRAVNLDPIRGHIGLHPQADDSLGWIIQRERQRLDVSGPARRGDAPRVERVVPDAVGGGRPLDVEALIGWEPRDIDEEDGLGHGPERAARAEDLCSDVRERAIERDRLRRLVGGPRRVLAGEYLAVADPADGVAAAQAVRDCQVDIGGRLGAGDVDWIAGGVRLLRRGVEVEDHPASEIVARVIDAPLEVGVDQLVEVERGSVDERGCLAGGLTGVGVARPGPDDLYPLREDRVPGCHPFRLTDLEKVRPMTLGVDSFLDGDRRPRVVELSRVAGLLRLCDAVGTVEVGDVLRRIGDGEVEPVGVLLLPHLV
ncbi:hypothetical protein HRbin26_02402 [bacterium HR26]|nr:hypothetical protein HRbin26_02402 [bacterium HR26]